MILNDQLRRQWLEAIIDGPHALDSVLVSLIAWGPDRAASLIGTGFIIAGFGRQAIAISASHNFDYIARVQRPWSISHLTAAREFTVSATRTIDVDRRAIRALYVNEDIIEASIIGEVHMVPEIDLAIFTMQLQEQAPEAALSERLAIDTNFPVRGREIAAIGYASMEIVHQEARQDGFESVTVQRCVAVRRGVITEVYPGGHRARWPCFETTVPIDGGMSGGPVVWWGPEVGPGVPMVACGKISRDFSCNESRSNYAVAGCSTMAMLWPALGLAVHGKAESDGAPQRLFLLELIRRKIVQDWVVRRLTHQLQRTEMVR